MDISGSRFLVLGANGVIGSNIAKLLQLGGAHVIGTARCVDSSQNLAADLSERLIVDMNDSTSIAALSNYLVSTRMPLNGIVNAAGIVGFGGIEETTIEMSRKLMQINHFGPAELITSVLPAVKLAAIDGMEPVLVGITGVVSERAFPGMSAYVASKTAHAAWLSTMALEFRRTPIRVLDAHPGHTETGLAGRAQFGTAPKFPHGLDPEHVAQRIIEAIVNDETELPSTSF